MVAYRFLRPDDLPLIVDGFNRCYRIHDPHLAELNLEAMKEEVLARNIWSSSCMVAREDGDVVGILIGAKREEETGLMYLGVRSEFQRRGIAAHMLRSLSSKLAILGPPTLSAEIPDGPSPGKALLEGLGYLPEQTYFDLILEEELPLVPISPAVTHIPVAEGLKLLDGEADAFCAWDRTNVGMRNRKNHLKCLALLSSDSITAFLLYCRNGDNIIQIDRVFISDSRTQKPCLQILIRTLAQREGIPIKINRICDEECHLEKLFEIGFIQTKKWLRYRCHARSYESID